MKKKLLITTLMLTGAYSGVYPMGGEPSNALKWEQVEEVNLDTSHAKRLGMGAFLATGAVGAAATWGASKHLSPKISPLYCGMVGGGISLAAAYLAYKKGSEYSRNSINTAEEETNNQILIHNFWAKKVNHQDPKKPIANHMDYRLHEVPQAHNNEDLVDRNNRLDAMLRDLSLKEKLELEVDDAACARRQKNVSTYRYKDLASLRASRLNLLNRLVLGPENAKKLKDVDDKLNVAIRATEGLSSSENIRIPNGDMDSSVYLNPYTREFMDKPYEDINQNAKSARHIRKKSE